MEHEQSVVDEPCAECGSLLRVGVRVSAGPVENRCHRRDGSRNHRRGGHRGRIQGDQRGSTSLPRRTSWSKVKNDVAAEAEIGIGL